MVAETNYSCCVPEPLMTCTALEERPGIKACAYKLTAGDQRRTIGLGGQIEAAFSRFRQEQKVCLKWEEVPSAII